jgi:hypothetical protein
MANIIVMFYVVVEEKAMCVVQLKHTRSKGIQIRGLCVTFGGGSQSVRAAASLGSRLLWLFCTSAGSTGVE